MYKYTIISEIHNGRSTSARRNNDTKVRLDASLPTLLRAAYDGLEAIFREQVMECTGIFAK